MTSPAMREIGAVEFERQYAERSGVTVEWLRAQGFVVVFCDCGDPICAGFGIVGRGTAEARGDEIVMPALREKEV